MLHITTQDRVGILQIDRPERRNAIGAELVKSLHGALAAFDRDPAIRAILVEASPPGFCAGSDLKELARLDLEGICRHEAETATMARSIGFLDKPVVVAVEGFALGGGFILAVACDVVVTAPNTRWHLPEVSLGWIPPWGLRALAARVGPAVARRLAWGGEPIDGVEAQRLGIADHLTDRDGTTNDVAGAHARRLAALPAPAVAAAKRFFAPLVSRDGEPLDALASRLFEENCRSPAAVATFQSFAGKA